MNISVHYILTLSLILLEITPNDGTNNDNVEEQEKILSRDQVCHHLRQSSSQHQHVICSGKLRHNLLLITNQWYIYQLPLDSLQLFINETNDNYTTDYTTKSTNTSTITTNTPTTSLVPIRVPPSSLVINQYPVLLADKWPKFAQSTYYRYTKNSQYHCMTGTDSYSEYLFLITNPHEAAFYGASYDLDHNQPFGGYTNLGPVKEIVPISMKTPLSNVTPGHLIYYTLHRQTQTLDNSTIQKQDWTLLQMKLDQDTFRDSTQIEPITEPFALCSFESNKESDSNDDQLVQSQTIVIQNETGKPCQRSLPQSWINHINSGSLIDGYIYLFTTDSVLIFSETVFTERSQHKTVTMIRVKYEKFFICSAPLPEPMYQMKNSFIIAIVTIVLLLLILLAFVVIWYGIPSY